MKYILSLQLVLLCSFSYSQTNQIHKIVVDKNSKIPLENVLIYNESDNSTTNVDGEFMFVSQKNEINLNLLGYTAVKTSFDVLKNAKDTIFMESKTNVLDEVVVINTMPFMKKVYSKLSENFLQNYTINFFLRNVLKRNNTTVALQDIYAKQHYNSSDKKKVSIEVLNMRKTSLFDKKDRVGFEFPDFDQFFDIRLLLVDKCTFTEVPFNDSEFKKVLFETTEKDKFGQIWKGYMVIHKADYAIVEYDLKKFDNPEIIPFAKLLISGTRYRTTKYNRFVQFTKDNVSKKYYVSNSKLECQVEFFLNKKTDLPSYFNLTIDYFTTNSPTNKKIDANFPTDKDIFKAKFPYSQDFWNNQNQLPLTQELELFLKSVADKKDKTKEYEIIGNF
jgi:hypothetical protein